MPVFQLILTSDTINEGREKINAAFSATTGLWSGSSGFQSLIHNNGTGNIASGDYAISIGSGNTASGDVSFAQGFGTIASGDYSFAQGFGTIASGDYSFAQGFGTSATTFFSHAEGRFTIASEEASHAEGRDTIASGNYSHAEGRATIASGGASHAEGFQTNASGDFSHAEGSGTTAGLYSHAEGVSTIASNASHAEGFATNASGDFSHAEGGSTIASGNYSHAQGALTTASGDFSHAEGRETIASGITSHAQGERTIASGNYSFAGGKGRFASPNSEPILAEGETSFAFYHQDIATFPNFGARADYSVILGGKNHFINSSSESSIIIGGNTHTIKNSLSSGIFLSTACEVDGVTTNMNNNIILGSENCSINRTSIGGFSNSSGIYSSANSNIINSTQSAILSSFDSNISNSTQSAILGGSQNEINSIQGLNSIIGGGGNTIEGTSAASIILGGVLNTITSASFYSGIINSANTSIGSGGGTLVGLNSAISAIGCLIPNDRSNNIISGRGALTRVFTGNTGGYFTMGWASGGLLVPPTPNTSNNTISIEISTGRIRTTGALFPGTGADYAEYFEWLDRNPNNEDRVGYFVSLSGEVIEKGNYNLIGVVSSNPAVIGDASSLHWNEMWLKDEFGRNEILEHFVHKYSFEYLSGFTGSTFIEMSQREIYLVKYEMLLELFEKGIIFTEPEENVDIYLTALPNLYMKSFEELLYTGDTSNFILTQYGEVKIHNPRFKPDSEYTPREERPEWSPIGLLGKLHVRTAESITGSTISANSDGMAVNGSDYHVLKQVMDFNEDKGYGVVQILFK